MACSTELPPTLLHFHQTAKLKSNPKSVVKKEQLKDCLANAELSRRDKLHLIVASNGSNPMQTKDVKSAGLSAGLTEINNWNISDILGSDKTLVVRLPEGWALTTTGANELKQKVGGLISQATPTAAMHTLRVEMGRVSNADTIAYVEEALKCFDAGLYRAAAVMSWSGAISLIQDFILAKKINEFNTEAKRRNPKWKDISTKDGFGRMGEEDFLDVLADPAVGVLGKNVKEELKHHCLGLRNAAGHPNSLIIAAQRVASHLEILVLNVFTKF